MMKPKLFGSPITKIEIRTTIRKGKLGTVTDSDSISVKLLDAALVDYRIDEILPLLST